MTDSLPKEVTVGVANGLVGGRSIVVVMAMSVSGSAAERFRLFILQAVHHMLKVRGTLQRLDPKIKNAHQKPPAKYRSTHTHTHTHTHLSVLNMLSLETD